MPMPSKTTESEIKVLLSHATVSTRANISIAILIVRFHPLKNSRMITSRLQL